MTPSEASKPENEAKAMDKFYSDFAATRKKPKFKIGDKVRITKYKTIFAKGYWPNWTEEVFVISAVKLTNPVTYRLKDLQDEELKGSFYEKELQKINQEVYRVEKVKRWRRNPLNGKREAYVKWQGYPDKFNQWIPESDFEDL